MHKTAPVSVVAAIAGIAVLALSGCTSAPTASHSSLYSNGSVGSKAKPTATPKAIDPCALLPKAEAEAIVNGTSLSDGVNTNPKEPSCVYQPDPNAETAQVSMYLGDSAKQFYSTDKRIGHTFQDVAGLGDESHLEDDAIFFRHGSEWVAISVVDLAADASTTNPLLVVAAKAIDSRLG